MGLTECGPFTSETFKAIKESKKVKGKGIKRAQFECMAKHNADIQCDELTFENDEEELAARKEKGCVLLGEKKKSGAVMSNRGPNRVPYLALLSVFALLV